MKRAARLAALAAVAATASTEELDAVAPIPVPVPIEPSRRMMSAAAGIGTGIALATGAVIQRNRNRNIIAPSYEEQPATVYGDPRSHPSNIAWEGSIGPGEEGAGDQLFAAGQGYFPHNQLGQYGTMGGGRKKTRRMRIRTCLKSRYLKNKSRRRRKNKSRRRVRKSKKLR